MSTIVDRQNLDFLLFDMFDLEKVHAFGPFEGQDRELISQLLDTAQRIAETEYLPTAAPLDAVPPTFENGEALMPAYVGRALKAYSDAGLSAQSFPVEYDGLGMSHTVSMTVNGMFSAANVAIANYFLLTAAAARLLLVFGTEEQKSRYASHMIAGRWMGTMCLSEPQAGSSLSDITTRADPAGDGAYPRDSHDHPSPPPRNRQPHRRRRSGRTPGQRHQGTG